MFDITHLIHLYGYFALAVIVFLESSFAFMLPGDSLLFTMGILAGHPKWSLTAIICTTFTSTLLGGYLAYHIGDKVEHYKTSKYLSAILTEDRLTKSKQYFTRYGNYTILFARFVPGVRSFAPIVAGVAGMNRRAFFVYNLAGAFLWSTWMPILGYTIGRRYPWTAKAAEITMIAIIFVSVAPIAYKWYKKKYANRTIN